MSNEHYRKGVYSEKEAALIVLKNQQRITEEHKKKCADRKRVDDMREAIELGITIEEYTKLVL